jgi:hypothetical protein
MYMYPETRIYGYEGIRMFRFVITGCSGAMKIQFRFFGVEALGFLKKMNQPGIYPRLVNKV